MGLAYEIIIIQKKNDGKTSNLLTNSMKFLSNTQSILLLQYIKKLQSTTYQHDLFLLIKLLAYKEFFLFFIYIFLLILFTNFLIASNHRSKSWYARALSPFAKLWSTKDGNVLRRTIIRVSFVCFFFDLIDGMRIKMILRIR